MKRAACCCVLFLLTGTAYGQADEPLLEELRQLNATMKQIASTLSNNEEHQRLQLLMKRVEMTSARLLTHEREVQVLVDDQNAVREQKRRLSDQLALLREQSIRDVTVSQELELPMKQLTAELQAANDRLESLSRRLLEAEARAAEQAAEVRAWETHLDRELRKQ